MFAVHVTRVLRPVGVLLGSSGRARMTVEDKGTKGPLTRSRDLNGASTVGLVIDPRFVDGFELDGFLLSTPLGA